jgi:antibiotic biosynthesis monooxygenase (ABM) superfamily enzyme
VTLPHRQTPTVVVTRRAAPGREREFERWLRRLVARARDAEGFVDAEIQAPDSFHPGEWVVVYRFTDAPSLDAWMTSPTRQALLASGNDLVVDEAREQVIALAPASERVTAVISVPVRRGAEQDYARLHDEALASMRTMPGFLRSELYAPVSGVQDDTIVMMAFDSREHLDHWLRSPERQAFIERTSELTEGQRTVSVVGGFAGWFGAAGGAPVKRWKSAVAVLIALVPTTLAVSALREALFPDLHLVPGVVIGNIIGVIILTWALMPLVTKWLASWLQR